MHSQLNENEANSTQKGTVMQSFLGPLGSGYTGLYMKGFIEFIRTQGVVGLAVGFILGGAVSELVKSLVNDIINPILSVVLGSAQSLKGAALVIGSISIGWGSFLNVIINFVVIAAVVYFGVKLLKLDEKLDVKKT
jgi:large conductance mechanosensitive channel